MLEALLNRIQDIGPARLAGVGAGILAVLGIIGYLATVISKPDFSLLYSELDPKDASRIVSKLEGLAIPFELQDNGTKILIPKQEVARIRLLAAEDGLPAGGSMGYEIFDKSDSFGTTTFVQDINLVRALEGELAKTIRAIHQVSSAKVHLVLPKRQLFSREMQKPTASILLKMQGNSRLNKSQVEAIQHLVAAAVPNLVPNQISVVDDKGALLARGEDPSAEGSSALLGEEAKTAFESKLARTVETLLEKSVGSGKVRAEVAVEMDYDRQTENSEIYDPDGQVVRSTQTSAEGQKSHEKQENAENVSVQNQTPNEGDKDQKGHQHQANKTEETVNYEISKTIKTHVKEGGHIKRLSVAVLVDGTCKTENKDKTTYVARSAEEMASLTKLVKSAVGFKEARGDSIEVVNMAFVDLNNMNEIAPKENWFSFDKEDIIRLLKIGALLLMAFATLRFVGRPLLNKLDVQPALLGDGKTPMRLAAEGSSGTPADIITLQNENMGSKNSSSPSQEGEEGGKTESDQGRALQKIEGEEIEDYDAAPEKHMPVALISRVEKIVEANPEASLEVIRNWIYKESI